MQVDGTKTIDTLLKSGEYLAFKGESEQDAKAKLIFYRVYDPVNAKEFLVVTDRKHLTFFQRVKLFFRTSDFSLKTVNRLASAAIEQGVVDKVIKKKKDRAYNLALGLSYLQGKIAKANAPKWFNFFLPHRTINIEKIDALKAKLNPLSPHGRPLHKHTFVLQSATPSSGEKSRFVGKSIVNPGNFCYANSAFKLFWRSPEVRKVLAKAKHGTPAHLLREVLQEMDKPGANLTYEEGKLKKLVDALQEGVLQGTNLLEDPNIQMDQQELLGPLFQVIQGGKNATWVTFKKTYARDRITKECAGEGKQKKLKGAERALELIQRDTTTISPFDLEIKENGSMLFFYLTEADLVQQVEDFFSADIDEKVEPENIINRPENKLSKHEEDLVKKYVGSGKEISTIKSLRTLVLQGTPPPFLPVYIARFKNPHMETNIGGEQVFSAEKNQNYVTTPFILEVPTEKGDTVPYQMTGIACHAGSSLGGGHYYNYFPWPDSPVDPITQRPIYWVRLSDPPSAVSKRLKWKDIADDVAANATTCMYDKLA